MTNTATALADLAAGVKAVRPLLAPVATTLAAQLATLGQTGRHIAALGAIGRDVAALGGIPSQIINPDGEDHV